MHLAVLVYMTLKLDCRSLVCSDRSPPGVCVCYLRQWPEQCLCGGRGRPEDQSVLCGGRGVSPQLQVGILHHASHMYILYSILCHCILVQCRSDVSVYTFLILSLLRFTCILDLCCETVRYYCTVGARRTSISLHPQIHLLKTCMWPITFDLNK